MVGGCSQNQRHLADLVSYDPVSGEWCTLPPMSVARSQMGVAVLYDDLYVVGGTNRHNEVLSTVERYNFQQVHTYILCYNAITITIYACMYVEQMVPGG